MLEKYRNDRHIAINVELSKQIGNCVELVEGEYENKKITLPMLIKAAKRMNPDRLIVDLFELEKYYKVEEKQYEYK